MKIDGKVDANAHAEMTADAKVKRGPESWTYIYIVLGFALAIEGTIIQMIAPLVFPWNIVAYVALGAATVWVLIFNGWVQNKLIGAKIKYESRVR